MVVLGGGEITVAKNATAAIPVRFVMQDGNLAVPLMSDLKFNSAAQGTATVENGVVTGVAAGDTEITITYEEVTPNLTAVCQVTVNESKSMLSNQNSKCIGNRADGGGQP